MLSYSHNQTFARLHSLRPHRLHDLVSLWRQRQALRRLDAAALRDLGLSRQAAMEEARRPLWDLPGHMRG